MVELLERLGIYAPSSKADSSNKPDHDDAPTKDQLRVMRENAAELRKSGTWVRKTRES